MKNKLYRIIDANFNRAKEGLRVVEDIFRFVYLNNYLRKKMKQFRHKLDEVIDKQLIKLSVQTRDSLLDKGKKIDLLEIKRKSLFDLVYANLQRVKEALRVLEEVYKLLETKKVNKVKKMRYELYDLEKKIINIIFNNEKNKFFKEK